MYSLLGLCLALAALLIFNALASLAAAGLWRALKWRVAEWPAAMRARLLFALRFVPPALSLLVVGTLLVPAYLIHEPRDTDEVVTLRLAALAGLSIIGIALALWRGVAAWLATRRLAAEWTTHAKPLHIDGLSLPAYSLRHPFPLIAIVGVFRPRIFVATHLLAALSPDELAAAIEHELGHLAARDNLKRALLRACRDALTIVPTGRALDLAWAECAEIAADEYAARVRGQAGALDLASALIKIARLVPAGAKPLTAMAPAGLLSSYVAADGQVSERVRKLANLSTDALNFPSQSLPTRLLHWACGCGLLVSLTCAATDPRVQRLTHDAIEHIVALFQ